MFNSVIVPLDGSEESARALRPGSAVARFLGVPMRIVAYHSPHDDGSDLDRLVHHQAAETGDVQRVVTVEPMAQPVADLLQQMLTEYEDPLIVMSTRGGGRAAGLVGSVANDILAKSHSPVMLIGPACDCGRIRLHGPMLVPTDAGDGTTAALELAGELASGFDFSPVVANVVDPVASQEIAQAQRKVGLDVVESAMVHRHADQLKDILGTDEIDFRVLHGGHPGKVLAQFADEIGASAVTMATAARSGMRRLTLGSVTAEVVANVACPVIAVAPV